MNNHQVVIGQTKAGFLELVAIEYEQTGKVFSPTQKAEKFLEKYNSWRNITEAVKYNLDLQDRLRNIFGGWAL